ncbi:MAG: restriction endonuclease subunit S [Bdellovibrionales bacterium]|jgi:type I restriction enzyme S subunit
MSELPENWVETTVGEVTLPIAKINQTKDVNKKIYYIDISSIDNKSHKVTGGKSYTISEAPSRARQIIKSGDVLFLTVRPYLRNIAAVPKSLNGEIASTGFSVLRPANEIEPQYLFHLCISTPFVNKLSGIQYGVSYPAVKDEQVREQTFPLPPKNEQKRIVEKIEELFSQIDAGEAALKKAQALIKQYRQSLLKAAVTGELTKEWREKNKGKIEPADKLLARILTERRKAFNGRGEYKDPTLPNRPNLSELPKVWEWTTLDAVTSFITSGSRGWAQYYSTEGSRFYRVGNLNRLTIEIDTEDLQRVSPPCNAEGLRTKVSKNDILLSITADVGMVGLASDTSEDAYINQHLALCRPVNEKTAEFISWALASDTTQRQLNNKKSGITKDGLTLIDVRNIFVPLPPLKEQETISDLLRLALSQLDHFHKQMILTHRLFQAERQSILKAAFSGKLVPQDAKDEPASVLLDRIKAERASTSNKATKSTSKQKKPAATSPRKRVSK